MSAYANAALDLLAERIRTGAHVLAPMEEYWEWQPESDYFLRQERPEPLWQSLYDPAIEELSALPAYRYCVAAFEADRVIAAQLGVPLGIVGGWYSAYDASDLMRRAVLGLLGRGEQLGFDGDDFEREYASMEEALYTESAPAELVAPITSFSMDTERIELDEDVAIARIPNEERVRYAEFGEFVTDAHASGVPHFAVTSTLRVPKLTGERIPEHEVVERAVFERTSLFDSRLGDLDLALRAFRGGRYELRGRRLRIHSWFPTADVSSSGIVLPGESYALDASAAEDLVGFWRKVQGADLGHKSRRYIGVALERLSRAAERVRMDDRLLDLAIASEALFLGGIKDDPRYRGELRFRLSLNAALLLGGDEAERRAVFRDMRDAYDQRSIIAHGGAHDEGKVARAAPLVEGHVRAALREFIDQASSTPSQGEVVDWQDTVFGVLPDDGGKSEGSTP